MPRSKYPLAVTDVLLRAFSERLGVGYDIGCKFGTTILQSPLSDAATKLNHRSLIGSFHGHAHSQRCQLSYLATYTQGLGLEDLEGCERFFSKSNSMAKSVRYTNWFHCQQIINHYLRHTDTFDTFLNLSKYYFYQSLVTGLIFTPGKFLMNNYHQALQILESEAMVLASMERQGIANAAIFSEWLKEEKQYLEGLSMEPPEETLEMDYYEARIKLDGFE
jgi:hypothetical protein